MSQSTGPILAAGAVTLANQSVFGDQPVNWRIPVATLGAAAAMALVEQGWPAGARAIAWMALVSVLFARLTPGEPAPVERLMSAWSSTSGTGPLRSI